MHFDDPVLLTVSILVVALLGAIGGKELIGFFKRNQGE